MEYPIEITPDGKFLLVTFPDVPEAHTQGDSVDDALEMASDALITALDFYFETNRRIPVPSKPKAGQYTVALPSGVETKVTAWNRSMQTLHP
jgi:antitoxin HicB